MNVFANNEPNYNYLHPTVINIQYIVLVVLLLNSKHFKFGKIQERCLLSNTIVPFGRSYDRTNQNLHQCWLVGGNTNQKRDNKLNTLYTVLR